MVRKIRLSKQEQLEFDEWYANKIKEWEEEERREEKEKERLKKERIKYRSRKYYYKKKFTIGKLQSSKSKDFTQFKYEIGKFLIDL